MCGIFAYNLKSIIMKKSVIILVTFVTSLLTAQTNYEKGMQNAFELRGSNNRIEETNLLEYIANEEPDKLLPAYEATQSDKIGDVAVVEDVEVPFSIIEDIAVFPGCENVPKSQRSDCFQEKIEEHVTKNFIYPEAALDLAIEGKVYVLFAIDSKGHVTNVRSRGSNKILKKEAEHIISLLPKMTPGKQRGKPVKMAYSVPVVFKYMSS
jgi:protein TonB